MTPLYSDRNRPRDGQTIKETRQVGTGNPPNLFWNFYEDDFSNDREFQVMIILNYFGRGIWDVVAFARSVWKGYFEFCVEKYFNNIQLQNTG